MRLLSILFATTVAVSAQSPLVTTFLNNNGGAVGGAVYFDLAAGATTTITTVDLNLTSAAATSGSINVFTFPVTSVGNELLTTWTQVSSSPILAAGPGLPSNFVMTPPLVISAGTSIGVCLVAVGVAHAYTNGVNPLTVFEACPLTLTAGKASNVPFTAGLFSPRIVNTNINFTFTGNCATVQSQGQGCSGLFESFYEFFATPAAFDLAGSSRTLAPTGTGYVVTPGGTFLPVGSIGTPVALVLGDDAEVTVPFSTGVFSGYNNTPWTGLTVNSNGKVSQAAGNNVVIAAPTVTDLLNAPVTAFYTQADFDPSAATGGGNVWFEETPGLTMVTWDNVPMWNHTGTTSNTFQMQFFSSGLVVIAWQAIANIGSNGGVMVGFSPGGPNVDPGNSNLSALTVIVTNGPEVLPLKLTAVGRPVQPTTGSPVNFNVTTS
ncbi:MAG: hypothetical protein ABIP94_16035, partial [Planctomycetota bacterium]